MITGIIILGVITPEFKEYVEQLTTNLQISVHFFENNDVESINKTPGNLLIITSMCIQPYEFKKRYVIYGPNINLNLLLSLHSEPQDKSLDLIDCQLNFSALRSTLNVRKNLEFLSTFIPIPTNTTQYIPFFTLEIPKVPKTFIFFKNCTQNIIDTFQSLVNVDFIIMDDKHTHTEIINQVHECSWGIWVDNTDQTIETQDILQAKILSKNIPLFYMTTEVYTPTCWADQECGLYCSLGYIMDCPSRFESLLGLFKQRLPFYKPRKFIERWMSLEACKQQLFNVLTSYSPTLVCITSMLHTPNTPFSYTPTRSVYTVQQRLEQTCASIRSVREYMPWSYIVISEGSDLTDDEIQTLRYAGCDLVHIVKNKKYSISPAKGAGEIYSILDYLQVCKICFYHFFKLSGRYTLNQNFDYKQWTLNKNNVNKPNCTVLYKVYHEFIEEFEQRLQHNLTIDKIIQGKESIEYSDIIKLPQTTTVKQLGVQGNVSVDGSFWSG